MLRRARWRAAAMSGPMSAPSTGCGAATENSSTRATMTGLSAERWVGRAGGSGSARTESRSTSERAAGRASRLGATGSY